VSTLRRLFCVSASAVLLCALPALAQTPPAPSQDSATTDQAQLLKSAETFVRNLFTLGPEYKVDLGPLAPSPAASFYKLPLNVTYEQQTQSGIAYISKDGKTFIQGEMFDISVDPFAENRSKLHIEGNPSKGPADARVTLVEFIDFECPDCRELHSNMKVIENHYPQIRVVMEDFPLAKHPWAETASIGARCAFIQSSQAYWKFYDFIFDGQDLISPENAWQKLNEVAVQAGLDADSFKACMTSPDAKKAVDANQTNGVALGVVNTPTVFINGRMVVGGDTATLERFIDFELSLHTK
jgi:protein-disulfide isomerase